MGASFPKGLHLFVIGDVHGCMHLLQPLAKRIALHLYRWRPKQAATIVLGDFIDRGPASRQVVEFLIRGFPTPVIALRGNHEALLLEFLDRPDVLTTTWGHHGGLDTLRSYGVAIGRVVDNPYRLRHAFLARLPPDHLEFLKKTPLRCEVGPYFFCHAGVRPGLPLDQQDEIDLLNIRAPFLDYDGVFDKVIIHGHTIVPRPHVLPSRINIDTGAYATGSLTCLLLRDDEMRFMG